MYVYIYIYTHTMHTYIYIYISNYYVIVYIIYIYIYTHDKVSPTWSAWAACAPLSDSRCLHFTDRGLVQEKKLTSE